MMKLAWRVLRRTSLFSRRSSIFITTRANHTRPQLPSRILVSTSRNIYENLALEDWLYENADLQDESFLLIWRDEPCVVVGRHQNPWLECNVPNCDQQQVKVARRKSGGMDILSCTV